MLALPPFVQIIVQFINLAIAGAPAVAQVYNDARKLIDMMFNAGMITVEQQSFLKDWADEHERATLAGEKPPELVIDPDPE